MKKLKALLLASLLLATASSFAQAQIKSVVGKAVNYDTGASGRLGIITINVGGKEYFAYTESANGERDYNPKIIGDVTTIGKTVRVYYSRIVREGSDNRLIATRIIEIKESRK